MRLTEMQTFKFSLAIQFHCLFRQSRNYKPSFWVGYWIKIAGKHL